MKLAIPLVVALLALTALAPLAEAQHVDDVIMTGIASAGGNVYKAKVQTFLNYRSATVTLTGLTGGVVETSSFTIVLNQQGVDPDPIPEFFHRVITDTTTTVDFTLEGFMFQWEQNPNQWDHAYSGTYNGYDLKLVVVKFGATFLQL